MTKRLAQKVRKDLARDYPRSGKNPRTGYCCALVDLGPRWAGHQEFCSFRAKKGGRFCGQHAHLALVELLRDEGFKFVDQEWCSRAGATDE